MLCADCYRGRLQKVRVICTGALSNVALLVSLYPEVIPRIEVVLMGGAMGVGNTGPVMEFSIQVASIPACQLIAFVRLQRQTHVRCCFTCLLPC